MITFLTYLVTFLNKVLSLEIVRGIDLYSMLFFNMFVISFWVVVTRR